MESPSLKSDQLTDSGETPGIRAGILCLRSSVGRAPDRRVEGDESLEKFQRSFGPESSLGAFESSTLYSGESGGRIIRRARCEVVSGAGRDLSRGYARL